MIGHGGNAAPVDLAIVGGGITGVGLARLAARHGLSVALVERRDLMWGASSRSSHMLHGGLRYLEHGKVALVREALHERAALSRMAPSLAKPCRFLVPLYRGDRAGPLRLRLGLSAYDLLAGREGFAPHAMVRARDARGLEPALAAPGLRGAGLYTDVVMDDARLGIAVARDAAAKGATFRTWTEVIGARPGREERTLLLRDTITGAEDELTARVVAICAGAWTDQARRTIGWGLDPARPAPSPVLRPSRGTHLVFPPITHGHGLVLLATDGRVFFVVPFADHALVGTTEVEVASPLAPAAQNATLDELVYLREGLERVLPGVSGLRPRALMSGIRPLLRGEGEAGELSREHAVIDDAGLIVVAGGKYTTFRVMARDALRAVMAKLGRPPDRVVDSRDPLPVGLADDASPERVAEWSVREAFARRLEDVLRRRSHAWLAPDRGRAVAPKIATAMAHELDWDGDRERREIVEWDLIVNAEERLLDLAGWPAA